jgi:hypothetical protein
MWVYSYWEIAQEKIASLSNQLGQRFHNAVLALRVYDITNVEFNGSNAVRYFDVRVGDKIGSFYINVGEFNRSWCVDIGFILEDGDFVLVARSNFLKMPSYGVSDIVDDKWASVDFAFDKIIYDFSLNVRKSGATSYDVVELLKERWKQYENLPSSFAQQLIKSGGPFVFKKHNISK